MLRDDVCILVKDDKPHGTAIIDPAGVDQSVITRKIHRSIAIRCTAIKRSNEFALFQTRHSGLLERLEDRVAGKYL